IVEGNPHSVRYDMFAEENSLLQIINSIADDREIHSIYIGAHGDDSRIAGLDEADISRARLRNMLRNANVSGSISGLYFGSWLIANERNALFLLSDTPTTGLKWIAGYTKIVDWIDSSAVDMIFWSKYLHERRTNRSRRRDRKSEISMVK